MKTWILAASLSLLLAVPVSHWARGRDVAEASSTTAGSDRLEALIEGVAYQNERAAALALEARSLASRPQVVSANAASPDDAAIADAVADWLEQNDLTAADLVVASSASTATDELEEMKIETLVQFFLSEGGTLDADLMFEELRDAGRIDEFLAWIEDMAAKDPQDPQLQVALGVAYLQKLFDAGATPEAGQLATQADQAFDRALELDPNNWDARFTKAVALSNWPAFLGKQPEAISQFETLIAQQELAAPSPGHARTYLYLGNMYVQTGEKAKAIEVWRNGLARYPDDADLREQLRLAGQ
jgi:tetratricopeptide (TPR) repeat protein